MLQQTATILEGKDSLAHLQERLEKVEVKLQQQGETIVERMDDLQDQVHQQERERRKIATVGRNDCTENG